MHPIRGATPHYKSTGNREEQTKVHRVVDPTFKVQPEPGFFDDAEQVLLEPGSLLYHPAGVWHRVEAEEDSISVGLILQASFPPCALRSACVADQHLTRWHDVGGHVCGRRPPAAVARRRVENGIPRQRR